MHKIVKFNDRKPWNCLTAEGGGEWEGNDFQGMMQHGTVKDKQGMAPPGCCFPSLWGLLLFVSSFDGKEQCAKRENCGRLFPGCGPFWSYARGMTFQDVSTKPVGLALWDLGRTYPSAKVGPGETCGDALMARGLKGKAGAGQNPSCKLRLQRSDGELLLCVASSVGLRYD